MDTAPERQAGVTQRRLRPSLPLAAVDDFGETLTWIAGGFYGVVAVHSKMNDPSLCQRLAGWNLLRQGSRGLSGGGHS
jgi:hypothetical protein